MKRYVLFLIASFFFVTVCTYGRNDPAKSGKNKPNNNSFMLKAANCTPATGKKFLEFNNVSALIETGGSMWQDRSRNDAAYEVPKGSNETVIYAGALWMGGTDVNSQLRIAALTFRNGNDFWAGPLSVTGGGVADIDNGKLDWGFADISPEVCIEYDNFYITERQEIELFNGWYECSKDPNCDVSIEYPSYQIPASILEWPGNFNIGLDPSEEYDFNMAPFFDRNTDGVYNPADGDYPWYDLSGQIDCRTSRRVTLYGDYNMWWVFNDKGNIHTETGGDPIGMEIKAQAFAFATNDEVNSMTFYNYELINRNYYTLNNTYFAVWVDSDIGCSEDDFLGCDVQRGLGYQYNADALDDGCQYAINGYPPAIGVDFFEGPYQDNDGLDNPLTTDVSSAKNLNGIPYAGLGIGYGDGIVDNERFGMKRFVYFDRTLNASIYGDPQTGVDFYNYMLGYWRDNTPFVYGGTGNASDANATSILTNYCFPGDSDPLNWATVSAGGGSTVPFSFWSEQLPTGQGSTPNPQGDRRFVQAAGPFVLEPGALNNITTGVVYGRAQSPDPFQSVELVRKADDKAQALFDNCFRILNGPDSPEMSIQELDKELILYLNKTATVEAYEEVDPIILSYGYGEEEAKYRFQGYQLYQVVDQSIGPSLLSDPSSARLIAQCDIKDGISQIINFAFDDDLLASVPTEMVNGSDEGIQHSFQVLSDAFAQGDVRLVNHKKYYFMVLAYGYNNFKTYDPADPSALDGQQLPYKAGRKNVSGGSISSYVGIPHIPSPESGGTIQLGVFGSGPKITRVEGRGNADNLLELTAESEAEIVANYIPKKVTYKNGMGPVDVKIIDPLNIQPGDYTLWLNPQDTLDLDESYWMLVREHDGLTDTVVASQSIEVGSEQLIPQWGISVNIEQYSSQVTGTANFLPELLLSTIEFADSSKRWLSGIEDQDGASPRNWIRSGTADEDASYAEYSSKCDDPHIYNDEVGIDDAESFEKVVEGVWSPYRLVAAGDCSDQPVTAGGDWADNLWDGQVNPDYNQDMRLDATRAQSDLKYLPSVDIVYTADKTKWTRCPVLETQDNPDLSWDGDGSVNQSWSYKYGNGTTKARVYKQWPKWQASVDKDGNISSNPGDISSPNTSTDPNDPNYICGRGMGWFPGYAIDVTTGERLNMAFGEDSWLGNHGGNDMMFNPSAAEYIGFGDYIGGGKHFVYVFRNAAKDSDQGEMTAYDGGSHFMESFQITTALMKAKMIKIWRSCAWVGYPRLDADYTPEYENNAPNDPSSFIATDVRVKLRVAHPYEKMNTYDSDGDGIRNNGSAKSNANLINSTNSWNPKYEFNTDDIAVVLNSDSAALDACSILNVVPNPYYAYSNYEFDKLENVVKIVNLPEICTIKIYTVNGTLVRTYEKDSPITSIDWDLKNHANIPISSGVYLIHINVPGVCEKVLKWFGVIRPPDLDQF